MRKHLFFLFLCSALVASAAERVTLDQLRADWAKYHDRVVTVTTPLVVCGSFYDSLILSPERLYCPEERAVGLEEGDSTAYWQLRQANAAVSLVVHCRNNYYKVRTGDRVRAFTARVTGERHMVTGAGVKTRHAKTDRLPKPGKGEIRIVGANIENYFADLGGYAHRRTKPEQQAVKTQKVVQAMKAMRADVFAVCEMQVGTKAPKMLLAALNKGGRNYAFVAMPMPDMDRIGGCLIYDADRLRPYGAPLSAYRDSTSHYYARMYAQGFEEIATGKRFILSVNHLKSKRPGREQYDTNLRRMQNTDSLLAMLPGAVVRYGDEDILLLGDYNCYTREQPVQAIVRAGYEDQLMRFCPDDYSYVYKGETGYLDRCFANPSMAAQIVRVKPWHINADWYYSHGAYKMRDKTLHRYSDHDPIIVDVKLR